MIVGVVEALEGAAEGGTKEAGDARGHHSQEVEKTVQCREGTLKGDGNTEGEGLGTGMSVGKPGVRRGVVMEHDAPTELGAGQTSRGEFVPV